MSRLLITNNGILMDGHWIPATQVHLDMDCKSGKVTAQIVFEMDERDVVVDVPASVRLVRDENPRERTDDRTASRLG